MTLEDASKPMTVKAEEARRLAEKWDQHSSVPIPVEATRLAQRSIAPSNMVNTPPPLALCILALILAIQFARAYWISIESA